MDQGTQPKKATAVKRGRPFQNGVQKGKVKKRSTRKPKVVTKTPTIQRPTRVKVQHESESDEHDQEDQQQQSALQTLIPYFSPFGSLNLTGPKTYVCPRMDTVEYHKLKSSVFDHYRVEIRKEKKKKNSIHLRPDLATIHKLAGGLNNAQCDRENVQAIRRKEDGTVESLFNWYAKDEGKTNKKLLDDIQSTYKYFDRDTNNNNTTTNFTSNISSSPSGSGIPSSLTTSPFSKDTKIVDLTHLDNDYSEQDIFITKLVSNKEISNRKMKTPKRTNNPGDVALIVLD